MTEDEAAFEYRSLGDVVADPVFAPVDIALRKGRHIGIEDLDWYSFVQDARSLLEGFYESYSWKLRHEPMGFYFLHAPNGSLGASALSSNAMLVGQGCLLLQLEPSGLGAQGRVTRAQLIEYLGAVVGEEELARRLMGKKKRRETREITLVHQRVGGALRELDRFGFVDYRNEEVELRRALVRFADPVRGDGDWRAQLPDLVRRGYVALPQEDDAERDGDHSEELQDDEVDERESDEDQDEASGDGPGLDEGNEE